MAKFDRLGGIYSVVFISDLSVTCVDYFLFFKFWWIIMCASLERKKGKGKCIYIALIFVVHLRRSGMDHTVLPAITPMPAFTS